MPISERDVLNPSSTRPPLQKTFSIPGNAGVFRVYGKCMEPIIRSGQYVLAAPTSIADFTPDNIVVICTPERNYVKRWVGKRGGRVFLRSINYGGEIFEKVDIPLEMVTSAWIVLGVYFNGVPVLTDPPMSAIQPEISDKPRRKIKTMSIPDMPEKGLPPMPFAAATDLPFTRASAD